MTEENADAVQLDKLNEMIAEQKGVRVEGLAIQPDTTASGDSAKNQARLMMARAERFERGEVSRGMENDEGRKEPAVGGR